VTITPRPRDPSPQQQSEKRSLDLVQRMIISALILVVLGTVAVVLSAYLVVRPEEFPRGDRIGLWVMTGFIGLVTAALILFVNRRRPYSPLILLGLLPMAVAAWWIF
jgi:tellurite resistance protein TehA-like permease